MDGYSNTEYSEFIDEDEEDEDALKKQKVKYMVLKEEDFIQDE